MFAILVLRPQGFTGGREIGWPGMRSQRPPSVDRPPTPGAATHTDRVIYPPTP